MPRRSGTATPTIAANAGYGAVDWPLHSSHPFGGIEAPYQIIVPTGMPVLLPWEDIDQYLMQGNKDTFVGRVSVPPLATVLSLRLTLPDESYLFAYPGPASATSKLPPVVD